MGITNAIDGNELRRLYAATEPSPVDVLNLIHFRNRAAYNVYGMMMIPTLRLLGASIRWAGTHVRSISGERQAEDIIVVRYPRIRRFLQMAMNPLYLSIANPVRVRGVRTFEASFTAPHEPQPFDEERWIAVVHSNADEEAHRALIEIAADAGGRHVYSSREISPMSFLRTWGPTDPNPLTFKRVAFFAFPSREDGVRAFTPETIARIESATRAASIQLYRRLDAKELLPRFRD